jgi:hypothetical protein
MRTTISLPDELGERARRRARREGLSLSAFVARSLSRALTEVPARAQAAPPFRLVTVGGEGPAPGIDLDRTSALLVAEDEMAYGRGEGGN